jgi:hypothetical protein
MLLLFWKNLDLSIGIPTSIAWVSQRNRSIVHSAAGFSVINQWIYPVDFMETSFGFTGDTSCSTVWNDMLLIGTSAGVQQIPIGSVTFERHDDPIDLTQQMQPGFNTASGLLSDDIIAIDAYQDDLVVLTGSGMSLLTPSGFLSWPTSSGSDVFLSPNGNLYLAEGNLVRSVVSNQTEPLIWETTELSHNILDLWVSSGDQDTVFVATVSGVYTIQNKNVVHYGTILSGSGLINSVRPELGSSQNFGHFFASAADGIVNVVNLKSGLVETTISGTALLAVDYARKNHK